MSCELCGRKDVDILSLFIEDKLDRSIVACKRCIRSAQVREGTLALLSQIYSTQYMFIDREYLRKVIPKRAWRTRQRGSIREEKRAE